MSDTTPVCEHCGHERRRHDPADGTCDAHAEHGFGPCPCGRTLEAVEKAARYDALIEAAGFGDARQMLSVWRREAGHV